MAASDTGGRLHGRRILITGASSGIGAATARMAADEGAFIIAAGRREDRLKALAEEVGPERIAWLAGDINDPEHQKALVEAAGPVDVLLNGAGMLRHAPFLDGDPADWERTWRTNVQSLLCVTQLVARQMAARGSGHIVNISSVLARRVNPFTIAYAASKFAVRAISDGLRVELREHGIRVTEIAPGAVDTEVFRDMDHPKVLESYRQRTFMPLQAVDVAVRILDAITAPAHVGLDVIEIRPAGQS